nr:hypothetical protein [Tanacetum cinerariifolium]
GAEAVHAVCAAAAGGAVPGNFIRLPGSDFVVAGAAPGLGSGADTGAGRGGHLRAAAYSPAAREPRQRLDAHVCPLVLP